MKLLVLISLMAIFIASGCVSETATDYCKDFDLNETQAWHLRDYAIGNNDTATCNDLFCYPPEFNQCYREIAMKKQDIAICNQMRSFADLHDSRYANYDDCVIGVAYATGDVNICNLLTAEKRGSCRSTAEHLV